MIYAFQDFENLYLVMDLLTGGDLRYHACKNEVFTEEQTTCLLVGLEYIHSNGIIHRDIKPENLVSDANGYIRLTDFGVAKIVHPNNSNETSGTPGYMSPEVLCSQNHSYPSDFYAIGVMGYEFMMGERPYSGKTRKDIKQEVLNRQAVITSDDLLEDWSPESAKFFNALLRRKPQQRIGYTSGIQELKNHKWFKHFNWTALLNKTMTSPFIPNTSGNYDKRYCEGVDQVDSETIELYQTIMQRDDFVSIFNGYTFISAEEANTFIKHNINNSTKFKTIATFDSFSTNLKINQDSQENKQKSSFVKNKTLLFKAKLGTLKKPIFLNRNCSNFAELQLNKDSMPNIKSRNLIENFQDQGFHPKSLTNMNNHNSKIAFKFPSKIFLKNTNNKKIFKLYRNLGNSLSCKIIKPELPALNSNPNFLSIPKKEDDIKSTSGRNKIMTPISISSQTNFISLHKGERISINRSFLKPEVNTNN